MREGFENLKLGTQMLRLKKLQGDRAVRFYTDNLKRKCLLSMSVGKHLSRAYDIVQEKADRRMVKQFWSQWLVKAVFNQKVQKMVRILSEQNDKKMVQRVFPTLVEVSYKMQIIEHLRD